MYKRWATTLSKGTTVVQELDWNLHFFWTRKPRWAAWRHDPEDTRGQWEVLTACWGRDSGHHENMFSTGSKVFIFSDIWRQISELSPHIFKQTCYFSFNDFEVNYWLFFILHPCALPFNILGPYLTPGSKPWHCWRKWFCYLTPAQVPFFPRLQDSKCTCAWSVRQWAAKQQRRGLAPLE